MASKLPYVTRPSTMVRIFEKIQQAKAPDRFTTDFLGTKLSFKGGTAKEFIPLGKKLGFLNSDGTPTPLYTTFRNKSSSGAAMAQALKRGYREIFDRNEYANSLNREDFKGLVVEITGLEPGNQIVNRICQTFESLKTLADFEAKPADGSLTAEKEPAGQPDEDVQEGREHSFDLGLSYTINLVLPKTDDPAVFNAIFRSLRDNLMRK